MAEEIKEIKKKQPEPKKRMVQNRSGQKMELVINGEAVAIPNGGMVQVPEGFPIPKSVGLTERWL